MNSFWARQFRLATFVSFFVALVALVALFGGRPGYYPNVVVKVADGLELFFLRDVHPEQDSCEATVSAIANAVQATCKNCIIREQQCVRRLSPELQKLLSAEAISMASSRVSEGVVVYDSADVDTALIACREAERQTLAAGPLQARCYPAFTSRPPIAAETSGRGFPGVLVVLISCFAAGFVGFLILRYESLHSKWSSDPLNAGPQKFHSVPTPRIGGVCLVLGLFCAHASLSALGVRIAQDQMGYLLLSALPAFIIGITEDVTKSVGVQTRLTITMVAAACGAWLLNGIVTRVDIPILNQAFTWVPLAIAFTIFSVAGVSNAMNIIDGYNGLAAGYAFIVLSALAYVSSTIGDMFLFISSIAMMGALVGFLAFNYPKGKIFLGDSGAYLLGFWVAELSVLLVARHPEISPWFPLALLIYPIFETVFSIYRRQVVRGNSPGHPDRLHMHQMIYMRLVRRFVGRSEAGLITYRNSMVAPYVWVVALLCCGLAVAARASTGWLLLIIVVFCAAYVRVYALIVHWKTPTWLIVRPRTQ